jgi:GNAT superfamily N-acetyltransferase
LHALSVSKQAGNSHLHGEYLPMPDLLVPLYKLPPRTEGAMSVKDSGVVIRRANTFEQTPVGEFIRLHFSAGWAEENAVAFTRQPVTSLLAIQDKQILGFATYESTRKAFFGPTGVDPAHRGRGIGKALLIEALWGLYDLGYAYGIIGAAGPVEFYKKTVGAIVIEGSVPGIYADLLR